VDVGEELEDQRPPCEAGMEPAWAVILAVLAAALPSLLLVLILYSYSRRLWRQYFVTEPELVAQQHPAASLPVERAPVPCHHRLGARVARVRILLRRLSHGRLRRPGAPDVGDVRLMLIHEVLCT
jgi:hypothetical protein